jgi:hypothetical protein
VTSAAAAAGILLALTGGTPGHRSSLQRLSPGTLHPEGPRVSLPGDAFGAAWAFGDSRLAIVTKPTAGIGFRIRLLHVPGLSRAGVVDVGTTDVCGLTFRGPRLVALVSSRLCYQEGGRFSILVVDPVRARVISSTSVRALRRVVPAGLAFGSDDAFVALGGGALAAVDLRTGAATVHTPRRLPADGSSETASWLGGSLLAVGNEIVSVRTWRARPLGAGIRGIVRAGLDLAAYGSRGVAVYTRSGRLRYRVTASPTFAGLASLAARLYVLPNTIVDIASGRTSVVARGFEMILAG